MLNNLRKYLFELLVITLCFIAIIKSFHYAQANHLETLNYLNSTVLSLPCLVSILAVCMILSAFVCSYFRPILKPVQFMKNVTETKTNQISIKKLLKSKELALILILAIGFFISYDNIMQFNDYSKQALLIIIIFYCPVSTGLTIRNALKENKTTLKDFKLQRKNK